MTLNFAPGWGYIHHPLAIKSNGQILWHLIDAVRKGGNFLFNVGPQASGYLADQDQAFMQELDAGWPAMAKRSTAPDPASSTTAAAAKDRIYIMA